MMYRAIACVVSAIVSWNSVAFAGMPLSWVHRASPLGNEYSELKIGPGDVEFNTARLNNIRVGYDMDFGENGTIGGAIDVDRVIFRGRPALWIQWKFSQEQEGESEAWPSLDLLIIDAETGALLARTAPSNRPRGEWGGPYSSIEVRDGEFRRLTISPTGEGALVTEPLDGPVFDFGSLGFVLPFFDLESKKSFSLRTYLKSLGDAVQAFPLENLGRQEVRDAKGKTHLATAIRGVAPDDSAIVTFYTSKNAPFFYGWDYRRKSDNQVLFQMRYRGHTSTELPQR